MPGVDFQRTLERIHVPDVLRAIGWEPKKKYANHEWRGYCCLPDHLSARKGRGSFAINVRTGLWQCFKCERHGSIYDLWRLMTGQPIHEAVLSLCEALGVEPVYLRRKVDVSNIAQFAKFARKGRPDPRRCDHAFVEDDQGNLVCEGCGKAAGVSVTEIGGGEPDAIVRIPVEKLVLDPDIQARAEMDADAIEEYAEAMARGVEFPPIDVFNGNLVADGFHRAHAARLAKLPDLRCRKHAGGRQAARDFAAAANQKHGLRRSRATKRRAAENMLADHPSWSDNRVAEHVGVAPTTVARYRSEMEAGGRLSKLDSRQGRDGRTIDTTNIGKPKPGQPVASAPTSPAPTAEHEPDPAPGAGMVRSGTQEKWRTRPELIHETLKALDRLLSEAGKVQRQMNVMDLLDSDAKAALDQVYAGRESLRRILAREAAKAKREET